MQLSSTAMGVFDECQRCFFLGWKMGVKRPRGIYPSLPSGVDLILKSRLDRSRGRLPGELLVPELAGAVLFGNTARLAEYRQWNSKGALRYTNGTMDEKKKPNVLVGALDDLLTRGDTVIPLDYKTKGSEPTQEDCEKYYTRQLDTYGLLLSTEWKKVADFGVLLYFWPVESEDGLVKFKAKPFILPVDPKRARQKFEAALDVINTNQLPEAAEDCEYCNHHTARSEATKKALIG